MLHQGIGNVAVLYTTTLFTLDVTSGYWQGGSTLYYIVIYFRHHMRALAMWHCCILHYYLVHGILASSHRFVLYSYLV